MIRRLTAALKLELGLRVASPARILTWIAFCAAAFFLKLHWDGDARALLPILIFVHVGLTAWIFLGLATLRESRQGLMALMSVLPLRPHEYLAARVAVAAILGAIESLCMAWILVGFSFRIGPFLAGTAALAALFSLCGFIAASVRPWTFGFLTLSIAGLGVLAWPLDEIVTARLLVPTAPSLLLIAGAFRGVSGWAWAYALGYASLGLLAALVVCKVAFARLRAS